VTIHSAMKPRCVLALAGLCGCVLLNGRGCRFLGFAASYCTGGWDVVPRMGTRPSVKTYTRRD